jgi:hypothetical protein
VKGGDRGLSGEAGDGDDEVKAHVKSRD